MARAADDRLVYVASPLGFAASTQPFMGEVVAALQSQGLEYLDPWDDPDGTVRERLARADAVELPEARVAALWAVDEAIGRRNMEMIERVRGVFAVLDGVDVDSGTAAEIGFAAARGLPVVGLRTDWRRTGDNDGCTVNLQVEFFIRMHGGEVCRELGEAATRMAALVSGHPAAAP